MEISSIIIGLVMFGAAIAFVSLPFRQRQQGATKSSQVPTPKAGRRESVLSALRDLDFDFKTGKVSEEDYQPLRAQLIVEAAQDLEAEKREEQQLEALIQTRRNTQAGKVTCEHCGASMEAGQPFCSTCGSAARHQSCPSCGKKIRAGDLYCSSCGSQVNVQREAVASS